MSQKGLSKIKIKKVRIYGLLSIGPDQAAHCLNQGILILVTFSSNGISIELY